MSLVPAEVLRGLKNCLSKGSPEHHCFHHMKEDKPRRAEV